jgi:hypothetical protein
MILDRRALAEVVGVRKKPQTRPHDEAQRREPERPGDEGRRGRMNFLGLAYSQIDMGLQ